MEHHVTNNLGAQAAQLLAATALEHGTYRNHFHAAPAAAAVVPRFQDRPPFAAGIDSGINHPGTISGLHSHSHAGDDYNQWVVDDATGQLRMRLLCSYTAAEVGLGHLIQQPATSAHRGAWRGAGFEATTQGWASLRAAKGLLVTSTKREATYGSAQSTQMDADEALAKLRAARTLGQDLSQAARNGRAHGLASHDADQALQRTADAIDPQQRGLHEGTVGGQIARQQDSSRAFTDPCTPSPIRCW